MNRSTFLVAMLCYLFPYMVRGQVFDEDLIKTSQGSLEISFIGHGSLMFIKEGYVIHIDPSRSVADYKKLPKADLVLITHHHGDHCDPIALTDVVKEDTKILVNEMGHEILKKGMIVYNGQSMKMGEFRIDVVPAYNVIHKRDSGQPYHSKGDCNGYVLTLGDTRIYIAGDTENIDEMSELKYIDIAFLPMNLPYTMTPEMVVEAVDSFKPRILYPYHHRGSNMQKLIELMEDQPNTELRIRRFY